MSTTQKLIAGFLLLLILILTNMLANLLSWKLDLTDGKLFTLSAGSKSLVQKLEEPIVLDFYFTRDVEGLPIRFKNYATRVEEMLRQFAGASSGMIKLNIINPKPDTEEEEAATSAGVSGNPMQNGQTLYFGLSLTQADSQEAIPVFDPSKEEFLEYDVAKALYTVEQWDKPVIGLISGLPVVGTTQFFPGQQPQNPDWVFVEQLRQTFEISEIDDAAGWPSLIDVLLVIHPVDLEEALLYEIDQYLLQGRPAIIAVDPASGFQKDQQRQAMMMGQPAQNVSSTLRRLFAAYGIDFDDSQLVVDMDNAASVQTRTGPIKMPTWLHVNQYALSADEFILSGLDSLHIIEAGSFALSEESDLELNPLIQTSSEAGAFFAMMADRVSPMQMASQITPGGESLTMAGFLRGNLNTAFPDGKPAEETSEDEEDSPSPATPQKPEDFLSKSTSPSNILLFADTDWLQDRYSVRRLNFLGMDAIQPLNDNLNLLGNAVEFMSGSRDLISIRGKGNSIRPFLVVDRIERQAQIEYQRKYDEINAEVQEFEARIRELQSQQRESNTLMLTPELRQEIQELNENAAEKRRERREVRKKLREKVENLGFTLAVSNLAAVPLLVFAAGVLFFIRRHNRK